MSPLFVAVIIQDEDAHGGDNGLTWMVSWWIRLWSRNVGNIWNMFQNLENKCRCRLLDENVRRGNGWCRFQGGIIVIGVIKFLEGRLV